MASAEDYWPSLSLVSSRMSGSIPILSKKMAWQLALLGATDALENTAIVFGVLPDGWSVDFVGRAEPAIVLDEKMDRREMGDTTGERYFAYINVEPVAAQLRALGPTGTGAVLVPLLPGVATYVDFRGIGPHDLQGRILRADRADPDPVSSVRVWVAGQPGAEAISREDGAFGIQGVVTVPGHPLFVDADIKSGFKHRYRVGAGALSGEVRLFQISRAQIGSWLGEIAGGVSPESGLIVGAFPELVQGNDFEPLYPAVSPLERPALLDPKVLSLARSGEAREGEALEPILGRFIAVQVPSGISRVVIRNDGGKPAWSELLRTQARVINVIGPE